MCVTFLCYLMCVCRFRFWVHVFLYLFFMLVLSSLSESWTVTCSHATAAAPACGSGTILSSRAGGALRWENTPSSGPGEEDRCWDSPGGVHMLHTWAQLCRRGKIVHLKLTVRRSKCEIYLDGIQITWNTWSKGRQWTWSVEVNTFGWTRFLEL